MVARHIDTLLYLHLMKSQLSLVTPEQAPGFVPIIQSIEWDDAGTGMSSRIRVIPEIGCMALIDEQEQAKELLVFTEKEIDVWRLPMPRTLGDLPQKHLLFNQDEAAKGLGLSATNTPNALRRNDQTFYGRAAIRGLSLERGLESIYVGSHREALPYQVARYGKHAILQAIALAGDTAAGLSPSSDPRKGTKRVMNFVERKYGDADAAILPLPPSWRLAQHQHGITHQVPPRKILARGSAPQPQRFLHRYGTAQLG